jgi:hypothetical protein
VGARTKFGALAAIVAAGVCVLGYLMLMKHASRPAKPRHPNAIPVAVLGDSDSHSYHDSVWFGRRTPARGGDYADITFQWTELLARLRPEHVDLGQWGVWGTRRVVARLQDGLGIPARTPRKEDFQFNFALSGARCTDLNRGPERQVSRLVQLMNQDKQRWAGGVVVVRIGINDLGTADALNLLATGQNDQFSKISLVCLEEIRAAISAIRMKHPVTRIIIVGLFDNSHWAKFHDRWQSREELERIGSGIDQFDDGLKTIVAGDENASFFDERGWFSSLWGGRALDGKPDYRVLQLPGGRTVTNTVGNHPVNSTLEDGHAGLVWNAYWARALAQHLHLLEGNKTMEISEAEITRLIDEVAEERGMP